ncbi:hypothetical protein ACI3LY_003797 [Candidozyma auris]|uniref:Mitochondrial group I intron splicing factor CCM1 n=2 Tax=Candidozyma auris TaxID=498019 RepID=A0AB36W9B3_CANAR|nr:hypothetical protein CJI97_001441 [[Candida] auris]PIS56627.1 hypothetical protein B9J08_001165 [[Candida] auris]QWW24093.1 hypothetical protein CA7LBN_002927 [[Candida] auris]
MKREFPLVRSFHNLVWNIRHYRHPAQRPSFKASRHPFCTNIQLQNASCAFWLKETSKDMGSRIVNVLSDPAAACKSHQTKQISTRLVKLHPTALYTPYGVQKTHELEQKDEEQAAKDKMIELFKKGRFKDFNVLIQEYRQRGSTLPADALDDMVEEVRKDASGREENEDHIYKAELETPWYIGKNDLSAAAVFDNIYPRIPKLYEFFQVLKCKNLRRASSKTLENGIWLCYHMDDANTLQSLLYAYLQKASYDSKTLSYAVNAFVLNYDVQFAKSLLQSIVDLGKPLNSVLISSTIANLVKVGAIFENLDCITHSWLSAQNCSVPDVRTIALIYKQYLKYGSHDEITKIQQTIENLGYKNHYLISMVKLHSDIQMRVNTQKIHLTTHDICQILQIRNSVAYNLSASRIYYESTLAFLARHATTNKLEFVIKEMMNDGIQPSLYAYNVISKHYVTERKFYPLLSLVKNSLVPLKSFQPQYVQYLFEAFLRTYPYEGLELSNALQHWLQNEKNILDLGTKQRILSSCSVTNVESNMTPFALQKDTLLNERKYDSPQWGPMKHNLLRKLKWKNKQQVTFRVNKGFRDILRKGVKPDYHILENTLRSSKFQYRVGIIESLGQMRMNSCKTRLSIIHEIMSNPSKSRLQKFSKEVEPYLNTSDKIFLARRLMNKNLFTEASELLSSVNADEVGDQRSMILLNLRLRNELGRNNFEKCDDIIRNFPINRVTLSPYILKQCCYIEKSLMRKIKASEANVTSKLREMTDAMEHTLQLLSGLIGDIEMRLASDKKDLKETMVEMFQILDQWIKRTTHDDF